jgi:hypothetical protein
MEKGKWNDPVTGRPSDLFRRLFIVALLTLGLTSRAVSSQLPLFDFHSWRQADTAAIARNFLEERFNPLYPQVDFRGARTEGYVETGLELHAFIVAALAKLVGFSTTLGRLVNVLLFPVAAWLLFRFVELRYGEPAGMIALFIYSLGLPLTMFIDRAFMNESLVTLFSILCLWSAQLYCIERRPRHLIVLVAASAMIAMVKPTYLVIAAPVTGLFVERFGWKGLLRPELWLVGVVTAASGALWFWHAHQLYEITGISFGFGNKLLGAPIDWSDYPYIVARRLVKDILGPVGVVFGILGAVAAFRAKNRAELWGLPAFAAYLVLIAAGNFHHNYYQLPIVPIGTVLASIGIVAGVRSLSVRRGWTRSQAIAVYAGILWIAAMSTFVRNMSAHNWYELDTGRLRLCTDLKPLLAETDRVAFVHETSPDMLFCLDRKGWLLNGTEMTPERLRDWTTAGGTSAVAVVRRDDQMVADLERSSERLLETPDFLAYRLSPGSTFR